MSGIIAMARQGRNGDTTVAHMSPGEMVIPREVAATRPDLVAHVSRGIASMGGNPDQYIVGKNAMRNPATGAMEFASAAEIQAAYQAQLGRAATQADIDYWGAGNNFSGFQAAAQKDSGYIGAPAAAPAAAPQASRGIIADAYQSQLGRTARQDEVDYWSNNQAGFTGGDFAKGVQQELAGRVTPSGTTASNYTPTFLGTPTKWEVTPDQTAAGLLTKYTDPNSQIIAKARAEAMDAANARGLSNSSLALTAADSAAYSAAVPLATNDAATNSKAAGYNADQSNQNAQLNANAANTAGQFNAGANNTAAQAKLNADTSIKQSEISANTSLTTAQINANTQKEVAKLNNENQLLANKLSQDNQTLLNTNSQAASAFNQAMVNIGNINMSNTMDANSKTQAVAQTWASLQVQLNVLGKTAGLDLTSSLNFAGQPGFAPDGTYVGFDAYGNTVGSTAAQAAATQAAAPAPVPTAGIINGAYEGG